VSTTEENIMHPSDSQCIIDLLHEEYLASVDDKGEAAPSYGSVPDFVGFCQKYLDQHRTVETFPADSNCGIRLSNNKRCVIHPVTEAGDGSMQDSGAVGVTEGKTQPGQEGVTKADDQKVI
jgi:hypothetical protein